MVEAFIKTLNGAEKTLKKLSEDLERAAGSLDEMKEYADSLMANSILVGNDFEMTVGKTFDEADQTERDTFVNFVKILEDTEKKVVKSFNV